VRRLCSANPTLDTIILILTVVSSLNYEALNYAKSIGGPQFPNELKELW
jgi:hypothetical protein